MFPKDVNTDDFSIIYMVLVINIYDLDNIFFNITKILSYMEDVCIIFDLDILHKYVK